MQSITLVSLNSLSDQDSNPTNSGRPTLCRNCSAIVGAGQATCAVCGTATTTRQTRAPRGPIADRETIKFARALIDRPHKFTIALLVLNLFAFLLLWQSSQLSVAALFGSFTEPVLVVYGAKLNRLIDEPYRQWWRLIVPMFLHGSLIHLMVNMYSLYVVGPYVEKLYGSARFVFIWVLTGIFSCVASYLAVRPGEHASFLGRFILRATDDPTVGASGALFGLVGVLFIFGLKYRNELPEGFKRAFGFGMLPIIVINLVIGYLGRGIIDNAGHLGGFFSGAAIALFIDYRRPGARPDSSLIWRVLQISSIAIVLISFYKVGRYFEPTAQMYTVQTLSTIDPSEQIRLQYLSTMTIGQETLAAVIHDRDVTSVTAVNQALMQVPVPDARASQLRDRLVTLLTKLQSEIQSKSGVSPPPAFDPKLIEERDSLLNDYDEWLKGVKKPIQQ